MLSISGLTTTSALDDVENKTPSVSDIVKKTDFDAKTSDIWLNVLLILIIISLRVGYLMQR